MAKVYGYYCQRCHREADSTLADARPYCQSCQQFMIRNYRFSTSTSFIEHYNPSLGMYVGNKKILNDAFKIASEQATFDSGIEHNFVYHDAADHAAFGLSDADVSEAHEYHDRVKVDGTPVKGNSPFKKKSIGPPR